jgi:hypothetical protein
MRFVKAFILLLAISLFVLFSVPGFSQAKGKDKKVVTSGVIQYVGSTKEYKYISINDKRFFLTPGTKVVDEKGKPLTFFDLKAGREVTVEIRGDDTRVRKTIIVRR